MVAQKHKLTKIMQGQTAVLIGATGLIGGQLLQFLLDDTVFSEVRILVRRPVSFSHPKLVVRTVSFDDYHNLKQMMGSGHSIFCCVGTTQKKVKGDKEAYRKVDYNIPVNTAHAAIENGFKNFLLVSSIGANKDSGNFYLQLKGSVEEAISKLPFESIHFFRPSLLLGNRQEFRAGEKIAQVSMKLFSSLFLGAFRKYKPIQGAEVAKAMVEAAKDPEKGTRIHEYDEMKK
jgi:uncharacterized protein YbjT (DUF2867 family)